MKWEMKGFIIVTFLPRNPYFFPEHHPDFFPQHHPDFFSEDHPDFSEDYPDLIPEK